MTVPVAIESLREEIDRHGPVAYFVSVGPDGRPHTVALQVSLAGPGRLVVRPGNSTVANIGPRPLISLLWPPADAGGYSLIVDGTVVEATKDGGGANVVSVEPTKAVLHRPAPPDNPGAAAHGSDCVRVFSTNS